MGKFILGKENLNVRVPGARMGFLCRRNHTTERSVWPGSMWGGRCRTGMELVAKDIVEGHDCNKKFELHFDPHEKTLKTFM